MIHSCIDILQPEDMIELTISLQQNIIIDYSNEHRYEILHRCTGV